MKQIKLVIYLTCVFSILGCKKDPIVTTEPPLVEVNTFDLKWANRLDLEKGIANTNDGRIYNNWFIFSGDFSNPTMLMAFDKESGDKVWEKVFSENNDIGHIAQSRIYNNIYVGVSDGGILGIDLDTRQPLWKSEFNVGSSFYGNKFNFLNNKIYSSGVRNWYESNKTSEIVEIDPLTGEQVVIYEIPGDTAQFSSITIYEGSLFEDKIVFTNTYPDFGQVPELSRQNLLALNMRTKEVVWEVKDFTDNFPCNYGLPPIIYEDVVITGGDWSMYGFDIRTGEQLWRTEISDLHSGSFLRTHHLLQEDRLYVNDLGYHTTCLNPKTGEVIWDNTDCANDCRHMLYNEEHDVLIYTGLATGAIHVIDALTGTQIHKEGGYENSTYQNSVVHDAETDMYFTTTFEHAVAFKLDLD